MGVFDAGGAAITGGLDQNEMWSTFFELEARVNAMADGIVIEGDGLLVERHPHFIKEGLYAMLEEMRQMIDRWDELHVSILLAL